MPETAARLLHITDTHLFAEPDVRLRGVDTRRSLAAVLAHAAAHGGRPDAALVTGDISQDETAGAYAAFRELLEPVGAPVWCLTGNHDAPGLMDGPLGRAPFSFSGTAAVPGWHVVLLSTHLPGDHGGRLPDAELARLAAELAAHREDHVLVALHHHPVPLGSRWLDELGLYNAAEFLAIIDAAPQVRCIVAGHVHQASDLERNGVRILTTPSTCFQFLPHMDRFAVDSRPPGYRWIELGRDGSVRTEVGWADPPG